MFCQHLGADGIFFKEPYLNRKPHSKTPHLLPIAFDYFTFHPTSNLNP